MAADPLVSIVLPTYNGAKYLGEAIQSCLSQTYSNWELIIVDDGSTDDTTRIVQSYPDARIHFILLRRNGGLPRALNAGFARARGDLLCWTSHDNRYHPEAIAVMTQFLQANKDVDFVYAGDRVIDEHGMCIRYAPSSPPEKLVKGNSIGGCFLYRRAVYEALGDYDPKWRLVEDYEYWLRARKQFVLRPLDRVLYDYRRHNESLTSARSAEVKITVLRLKSEYTWDHLSSCERRLKLLNEYLLLSWRFSEDGNTFQAAKVGFLTIALAPHKLIAYKPILRVIIPKPVRKLIRSVIDKLNAD